jgi:kynurenine formamidase
MNYDKLPRYDALPGRAGAPAGASWGVFGDDDQVGTVNFLGPERVREAAALVRTGRVFPLNLELHLPDPPLFHFRKPMRHDVFCIPDSFEIAWDDRVELAPQASSQWDGLTHVRDPEAGFYNGAQPEHLTGTEGTRNGIEHWARRGIVGRGVLADVPRFMEGAGRAWNPVEPDEISLDDLEAVIRSQGLTLRPGDVLLLRTGFVHAYRGLTRSQREALAADARAAGLKPNDPFPQFFWDHRIAAIAADNIAVERWPIDPEKGFLHIQLIAHLGMALGEMWDLDALAEDCAADGVYECMVMSAPLNLRGGVGSPPNALAIK